MTVRVSSMLAVLLLAACSGAGGNATSTPPVAASPSPAASSTSAAKPLTAGSALIFIPDRPKASAHRKGRLWVSPSTLSVSITATAADGYSGYVITAVPPSAPNCTPVTGGRTCMLGFTAPPGTDTVQITAYDAGDAYDGNPVATATVAGVAITAGAANTLPFTLGGIVGREPTLAPASFVASEAIPQDFTLTITGDDFDGNPIAKYDSPLSITQTDTTGTYTLSTTSIADSSVTPSVTIHYNGGTAPTTITVAPTSTISANYYNVQPASITITPQITGIFVAAYDSGVNVYAPNTGTLIANFCVVVRCARHRHG